MYIWFRVKGVGAIVFLYQCMITSFGSLQMGTYKTPVCYGIYRHPDCDIFAHPCNISLFMIAFNSVKERKKKHAFFPRRSRGDRHASTRMHSLPMQKTKNKSYRNHSYTVKLKPVQIPLQKFKRLGGKKKKKNCLISKCEGGELMHCGGVERGGRMSFGHKEVQKSWHVRVTWRFWTRVFG